MNKPLYCFRLWQETGKIQYFEINDYEEHELSQYTHRKAYIFTAKLGTKTFYRYSVRAENIDKFVSDKLFTFNKDVKRAYDMILEDLLKRQLAAQAQVEKYKLVRQKITENND